MTDTKKIYKALANFQQEVPVIFKGTEGYGYSYADLPAVFEVINPLLQKHKLGFTQLVNHVQADTETPNSDTHQTILKTIVFHTETGETIESNTPLPQLKYGKGVRKEKEIDIIVGFEGMNSAQAMGSLITYFRRYALSSLLGLVTDKDTDAQVPNETEPDFSL